ncbi:hypothetical protein NXA94_002933 [Escherichia coli]|nr:hypothetical protein [Escherichia coli]
MTPERLREVHRISSNQHREKIIMSYHQLIITNTKSADSARIHHVLQQPGWFRNTIGSVERGCIANGFFSDDCLQ